MSGGGVDSQSAAAQAQLGEAWQGFAERIAASAATVAAADFATTPRDQAEGHRYLARLIAYALQERFCFSDPDFPAFHRGLDDLAPWGAPNIDNVYLTANIDGRRRYRVWGNVAGIDGFIVNINEGVYPIFPGYRTSLETSHRELHIEANGDFELMLSPEPRPEGWTGNWLQLGERDQGLGIRQYLVDWQRQRPAVFHIERIGQAGEQPQPLTPARTAEALHDAVAWAQTLAEYYLKRLADERATRPCNQLAPPQRKIPGSAYVHYGIAFFDVAEDEALLIETPIEPAPYWSFQLYNLWNEFTDPFNRVTSLNHRQAHIDADGIFRVVIAQRDPGTANWLDPAGQRRGYLWYRWIWADRAPAPQARLVKLAELDALLPTAAGRCDAAQRAAQIAARRRHLQARYHR